jgi:imidazoleglycerol-phosphate dehydratase
VKQRTAATARVTKETDIDLSLNLDRPGKVRVDTTIPFLDHMLTLFAHHANLSLVLKAKGDTGIDDHHLVEDTGITLGKALADALGKKEGIYRYGNFLLPMDESLAYIALDLSGRPYLSFEVKFKPFNSGFDYDLVHEFFYAFAVNAGMTLHVSLLKGRNNHHIAEALFKGFGRALRQAVERSGKQKGIPSTKGKL